MVNEPEQEQQRKASRGAGNLAQARGQGSVGQRNGRGLASAWLGGGLRGLGEDKEGEDASYAPGFLWLEHLEREGAIY